MLKMLKSAGVGPLPKLSVTFAPRINLITGDSGLGKSFLLDLMFWTFSETWPGGRMALPDISPDDKTPIFEWNFPGKNDFSRKELSAYFDFNAQVWRRSGGRHGQRSLVVYADSRNSFAVWDPSRNCSPEADASKFGAFSQPTVYQFNTQTLADGLKENGRSLCNGLIHDWVNWYYQGSKPGGSRQFKDLEALIELLSPPGLPMKCGEPRHVFAGDTREFPTLKMPYGEVALPHWPTGIARVIGLAYVLVWSWHEHLRAAKQRKEQPVSHLVLLIDDLETHISPAWQRTILMALSRVAKTLDPNMGLQLIASTNAPLTLASLEPHFMESEDALFWLHRAGQKVDCQEMLWARHGDVNAWLMSIVFNLKQPRSVEAENAVLAALRFLDGDNDKAAPGLRTKAEIDAQLVRSLPPADEFLTYWRQEAKDDPSSPEPVLVPTQAFVEPVMLIELG